MCAPPKFFQSGGSYFHIRPPGRRVEDLTSFWKPDRLGLKAHLSGGDRAIVSNVVEMAAISQQGGGDRKKKTPLGASLSLTAVAGRDTTWLRDIIHRGRISTHRVRETRLEYPTISAYLLLNLNGGWFPFPAG